MKKKRFGTFSKRTLSNLLVVGVGVLLFLALNNLDAVKTAISTFLGVFQPFVMGIGLAYLLNMPMRFFERHFFAGKKYRRAFSILLTYGLAVLLLALLIYLILPQLVESVLSLGRNITVYLDNLNHLVGDLTERFDLEHETLDMFLLSYTDLVNQIVRWAGQALPDLIDTTLRIGSGLVGVLTALIASVYMLAGKEKLILQCKRLMYAILPRRAGDEVIRVSRLSNSIFSGFISGKLIDSAIIGVICFIFMSIMNILSSILGIEAIRMSFSVLISVVIGVTNVIPFFGPFIGAIPSITILLMVNPWSALWFTVFIIVLQQFDGNILGPRILGETTGLPAMWVLVAIIVGGGLFGFTGMLLGVPTTAVLYTLGSDFIAHRLAAKGLKDQPELTDADTSAPPPDENIPYATHPGEGTAAQTTPEEPPTH